MQPHGTRTADDTPVAMTDRPDAKGLVSAVAVTDLPE